MTIIKQRSTPPTVQPRIRFHAAIWLKLNHERFQLFYYFQKFITIFYHIELFISINEYIFLEFFILKS